MVGWYRSTEETPRRPRPLVLCNSRGMALDVSAQGSGVIAGTGQSVVSAWKDIGRLASRGTAIPPLRSSGFRTASPDRAATSRPSSTAVTRWRAFASSRGRPRHRGAAKLARRAGGASSVADPDALADALAEWTHRRPALVHLCDRGLCRRSSGAPAVVRPHDKPPYTVQQDAEDSVASRGEHLRGRTTSDIGGCFATAAGSPVCGTGLSITPPLVRDAFLAVDRGGKAGCG